MNKIFKNFFFAYFCLFKRSFVRENNNYFTKTSQRLDSNSGVGFLWATALPNDPQPLSIIISQIWPAEDGLSSLISKDHLNTIQRVLMSLNLISDKPICENFGRIVQGVGRGQASEVICPVSAHPAPSMFYWSLNNTQETVQVSFTINELAVGRNKLK